MECASLGWHRTVRGVASVAWSVVVTRGDPAVEPPSIRRIPALRELPIGAILPA